MTGTSRTIARVIALREARDRAQNPEFKQLWDQKLKELIRLAELGRSSYDTVH
jgi:antitoxin (DNA-binding transcriptional repressor) of toxin-antitoxin stability system